MKTDTKRLRYRIFCAVTAFVMVFSLIFASSGLFKVSAAETGKLNITNFRLWINQEPLEDGVTVNDGDEIQLAIDWRINNNEGLLDYSAEIDTLGIDLKKSEGPVYTDGIQVGTYELESNVFTIHLIKEAVENKSNLGGGALLDGVISLDSDGTLTDGSEQTIGAGDKTYNVIFDSKSGDGSASVSKLSVGSITYDDGKYYQKYSITVNTSGKISNIVLTDSLPEGLTLDAESLEVSPNENVLIDTDNFKLTFPDNATKKTSVKYTVTYRAEISQNIIDSYSSFKNTADLEYTDAKGDPQAKSSSKTVTPIKPKLNKSGSVSLEKGSSICGYGSTDHTVVNYTITVDLGTRANELSEDEINDLIILDTLTVPVTVSPHDENAKSIINGYTTTKVSGGTDYEYQMQIPLSRFEKQSNGTYKFDYTVCTHIYANSLISSRPNDGTLFKNTVDAEIFDQPLTSTNTIDTRDALNITDMLVKKPGSVSYLDEDGNITSSPSSSTEKAIIEWELTVDFSKIPAMSVGGPIMWDDFVISDQLTDPGGNYKDLHYFNCTCGTNGHNPGPSSCNYCDYCTNRKFKLSIVDKNGNTIHEVNINQLYTSNYFAHNSLVLNDDSWTFTLIKDQAYQGDFNSFVSNGYKLVFNYETITDYTKFTGLRTLYNAATVQGTWCGKTFTESGLISPTNPNPGDNYNYATVYLPDPNENELSDWNIGKQGITSVTLEDKEYNYTENNFIGWAIKIPKSQLNAGDTLSITDTPGANHSYVENSAIVYETSSSSYYPNSDSKAGAVDVTVTDNKDGTITFDLGTVSEDMLAGDTNKNIIIYYQTKINEETWYAQYPSKTSYYYNYAQAEYNGEDLIKITASQKVSAPDIVKKEGDLNIDSENSRITADYTINVNRNAADLDSGKDKLEVTDTMAKSFVLNEDSVKVYKDSADDANLITDYTMDYNRETNVITFTVPNKMHIIIEYSVTINVDPIDNPLWYKDTDNTVQVSSFDVNESDSKVSFASIENTIRVWAYDMNGNISIYKFWNNSGEKTALPGAEFALYSVYDNNGHKYEEGEEGYVIRNDIKITDDSGKVTVENLPLDRIYKLVETKAPDGYLEGEEYYFLLKGHYGVEVPDFLADETVYEFESGEMISYENVKYVTIEGTKTWTGDDSFKQEYRPENIALNVYRRIYGGEETKVKVPIENITWDKTTDPDKWTYSVDKLPAYDKDGNEYTYRIEEADVNGYTAEYSGDNDKNITNTLKTTTVSGTKTWADEGIYKESARPDSIKLKLYADGEEVSDTKYSIKWTNNDSEHDVWSYAIEDLPKLNADGEVIVYTIKETAVNGYVTTYSADSFNITNTYQLTQVTGTKTWSGDNANVRPDSVTLVLYADGAEVTTDYTVIWTNTDSDVWNYSVTDLPKYNADGEETEYTVVETEVAEGYTPSYDNAKLNITNDYQVPLTEISGTKEWKGDEKVKQNTRPDSVDIVLLANGEPAELDYSVEWTDTDTDVWSYTIKNIPTRDDEGNLITYTIREENVPLGYTDVVYGYDIVNTFTMDKTEIAGTKTWVGDSLETRPQDITLTLYADGEAVADAIPVWSDKDTEKWSYVFEDIDKYAYSKDENGTITRTEIVYTVEENASEKYTAAYSDDTLDITNTRITEVEVSKVTVSGGDELEGAKLTVKDKDGNVVETWVTGNAPHIITGLEAGETYTLTEESAPAGYTIAETIEFTVSEDGTVTKVEMIDGLTVTKISKQDAVTGDELAGAKLVIKDSEGNIIEEWISDGTMHEIKGLIAGEKYTLTEISAPDGYEIAESIEFSITDDGSAENVIVMKDARSDDSSSESGSSSTDENSSTASSSSSNSSGASSGSAGSGSTSSANNTSSKTTTNNNSPATGLMQSGAFAVAALAGALLLISGKKKDKND